MNVDHEQGDDDGRRKKAWLRHLIRCLPTITQSFALRTNGLLLWDQPCSNWDGSPSPVLGLVLALLPPTLPSAQLYYLRFLSPIERELFPEFLPSCL